MTNDRLEQADVDLRDFGWAPGGYAIKCRDCTSVTGFKDWATGAKHSWRCERHARIAKAEAEKAPARPTEQADVEGLVERLRKMDHDFMFTAELRQAATTITAQAAEIARLKAALQGTMPAGFLARAALESKS